MTASKFRIYWLPLILGVVGAALLIRILLLDAFVLLPEHIDVVLLVLLLSVALILAIHTIVRISMNYLRIINVQRVRRETLAEHRRFLQRLDHELKNPLTAIQAGLKTLSLTTLNEHQCSLIQTMETEMSRLSRLVTDLRKLGAFEAQSLNQRPVDIEAFIQHIIRIEQDRIQAGQRQFTSYMNVTYQMWLIDEDLLALALHNLLDNAFKYTHPQNTILLELQAQQDLVIRVIDNGIGIATEALPYIWEELYRAEQSGNIGGNGIGLALVQAIVNSHGGKVSVTSALGLGTTVTIRLPSILQL
jgi:two-component system, OmpR family, sensor kinase